MRHRRAIRKPEARYAYNTANDCGSPAFNHRVFMIALLLISALCRFASGPSWNGVLARRRGTIPAGREHAYALAKKGITVPRLHPVPVFISHSGGSYQLSVSLMARPGVQISFLIIKDGMS